jgi:LacI family transcriptional regulator
MYFFRDEKAADSNHDRQTAHDLEEWLKDLPKPIAIMGADDGRALHVLEAFNDLGISVPREVAILGVDNNVVVCESLLPSLSSVAQNNERVGWEAAAMLDRMLEGKDPGPLDLMIPPQKVVTRMSSDVIAVEDQALLRALGFIREHLAEPVSVEQIARAAGVSRSLLEKRFRTHLGTTITDLIRDQRLKAALKMMVETPMLIKEIAEATGFRRATYFSNVFREQLGETPREWRAQHSPTCPDE